MTVLKCTTEKSLQMPLILLLSVILVMLSAINRQIALSVRCVVEKAVADGLAEAEEVAAKGADGCTGVGVGRWAAGRQAGRQKAAARCACVCMCRLFGIASA